MLNDNNAVYADSMHGTWYSSFHVIWCYSWHWLKCQIRYYNVSCLL